jgi:hypothetical protein
MVLHATWYIEADKLSPDLLEVAELKKKRNAIVNRLRQLNIETYSIPNFRYVDHRHENFRTAIEAGHRLMILSAVSYAAEFPDEKLTVINWMKDQDLWHKASGNEQAFMQNFNPTPEEIVQMSWRSEAAYTLAWCLQLIDALPPIDRAPNNVELEAFHKAVPPIGSDITSFLKNLKLRPFDEIYEENLVNEFVTSYARDLMITGKANLTNVHDDVVIERHYVLNWLRRFGDSDDWDKVDTST